MEVPPNLALFPAPLGDVAAQLGDHTADRLLDVLPEVIRRSRHGEFMNDEQAQVETGLTKRQLRHLRETRQIEFVKRGRLVLYPTRALFSALDAGRVPARPDKAP